MKTVLLVEDSEDTREIYTVILEHHGYRVLGEANGADGITTARAARPDVIVMNVSLPGIDGLAAAQILKHDPATSDIPIIACTAFIHEDGAGPAEAAGCESYLEKPCDPSRLLAEVERLMVRAPAL